MNTRETATVLAALRYWQREGLHSAGYEHDIATDSGSLRPLTAEEIDALAERLNAESPEDPEDDETPEFLKAQFAEVAAAAREAGQTVEINSMLPYVAIYRGEDDDFYFEGHEAEELLSRIPADVDAEDYLLWSAQSW